MTGFHIERIGSRFSLDYWIYPDGFQYPSSADVTNAVTPWGARLALWRARRDPERALRRSRNEIERTVIR